MNAKITPYAGEPGVLCMPMRRNIPEPKDKTWKLTTCPTCGRECWVTPGHRKALKENKNITAACTECAVRQGIPMKESNADVHMAKVTERLKAAEFKHSVKHGRWWKGGTVENPKFQVSDAALTQTSEYAIKQFIAYSKVHGGGEAK